MMFPSSYKINNIYVEEAMSFTPSSLMFLGAPNTKWQLLHVYVTGHRKFLCDTKYYEFPNSISHVLF